MKKDKNLKAYNLNSSKKGIALLIAMGTMILIFVIAALGIYIVTRGLNVSGGQQRYQSSFEACEGGLEIGMLKVDSAFAAGIDPSNYNGVIGKYNVTVDCQPLFAVMTSGAAVKFARGYFGVGQGISQGGVNLYYHIQANAVARGVTGEQVTLEIEQKKVIGID
jgi:hypothetical protein